MPLPISGNYAYVADESNELVIIDISDPLKPVYAGEFDTSGYARSAAISGNYSYVADTGDGLIIIDISNPAKPSKIGGFSPYFGNVYDVAVSDNLCLFT